MDFDEDDIFNDEAGLQSLHAQECLFCCQGGLHLIYLDHLMSDYVKPF